jgi:hypothetical protein
MLHGQKMAKTYNSGDSLVVTHLTTNPPVSCLSTAERTGNADFKVLWSYVLENVCDRLYNVDAKKKVEGNEMELVPPAATTLSPLQLGYICSVDTVVGRLLDSVTHIMPICVF